MDRKDEELKKYLKEVNIYSNSCNFQSLFSLVYLNQFNISYDLDSAEDKDDWVPISFDIFEELSHKKANNSNGINISDGKIYYRTVLNKKDHQIYIDIKKPLNMSDAISVLLMGTDSSIDKIDTPFEEGDPLKKEVSKNGVAYPVNPFNIYTYEMNDAKLLLFGANSSPWSGKAKKKEELLFNNDFPAENHAFIDSYMNYHYHHTIPDNNYYLNHAPFLDKPLYPGFYFWHYHLYHKRIVHNNDLIHSACHVFFGLPIYIHSKDIERFSNDTPFDLKDLEMFNTDNKFLKKHLNDIIDLNNKISSDSLLKTKEGFNDVECISLQSRKSA